MERKYTKISRYNPRISFDQYTTLLQRKANAVNNSTSSAVIPGPGLEPRVELDEVEPEVYYDEVEESDYLNEEVN